MGSITRLPLKKELKSHDGKEILLITPNSANNFLYQGSLIWNVVRDLVGMYDFNSKTLAIKSDLKKKILKIQLEGDLVEWESSWNSINCNVYNK